MAVHSHTLTAMNFRAYEVGEVTLARQLRIDIPKDSLTIVDRNFLIAADLNRLCADGTNPHWLTRAKSTARLRNLQRFAPGDELVEPVGISAKVSARRCC
jgi:hypothetical protein